MSHAIINVMVTTLAKAIQRIGKMSVVRQREAARVLNLFAAQDVAGVSLTTSQVSEVKKRLASSPKYTSAADVRKFFSGLGL